MLYFVFSKRHLVFLQNASFFFSCSNTVCKNVPVVDLDGSAKELSFLISESVPISDLPVDNLGLKYLF